MVSTLGYLIFAVSNFLSPPTPPSTEELQTLTALVLKCRLYRRVTLQRADQIWEHMLEQTEQTLSLRQHAVAVISMAETSVTMESLQNPWLNLLFRAPLSQQPSMAGGPNPM